MRACAQFPRPRWCTHTGASAHEVRVLEASPVIDAVIAKGVGKSLPSQLQQLLSTKGVASGANSLARTFP